MFCLHFSFIGWSCLLTFGIRELWLTPYVEAANAAFYGDIPVPLAEIERENGKGL